MSMNLAARMAAARVRRAAAATCRPHARAWQPCQAIVLPVQVVPVCLSKVRGVLCERGRLSCRRCSRALALVETGEKAAATSCRTWSLLVSKVSKPDRYQPPTFSQSPPAAQQRASNCHDATAQSFGAAKGSAGS